ncbi:thioredoxin fold domain-containing protein [Ramlibacter sp. AN1133]|uniref:thioredoxin fold domain-containing protein n=1 Tax=Ramlibacter sp. AN1133 TaxID=3133429 RepID=UPI0030C4C5D0
MRRRLVLTACAAACLLAACGKESSSSGGRTAAGGSGGKPAPQPVSIEAIEQKAKGFNVGATMATRVVYVFFDPQCPHCAVLWESVKPLKSQARFVWIPVGLIGEKSIAQGAGILGAADPVTKMEENEASVRAQQGGIGAMGVEDAQKEIVKANTALFTSFGFTGVPTIVGKHAQTGGLVTIDGSVPAVTLQQRLGWSPAGG